MINSVFIHQQLAPGDALVLTGAIRDLKNTYPNIKINVSTTAQYIWDNNPHLDRSVTKDNAEKVIKGEYPLIHKSNEGVFNFFQAPRIHIARELGLPIGSGEYGVDVHLTAEEKNESLGLPERYWVINAGFKSDFTNKGWEIARYAEVVHRLRGKVQFVQIGEANPKHTHKEIPGAINMVGKTNGRKLLQVIYHSAGVLTGCSYPMHLSSMIVDPKVCRNLRPCVCILGGREPIVWVQQRNMQCLHCSGLLDCCRLGGCWRSRIEKLNDNTSLDNSICANPVKTPSGQTIPLCMDMITVDDVVRKIEMCEYGWKGDYNKGL
jgi:hypothetical protein